MCSAQPMQAPPLLQPMPPVNNNNNNPIHPAMVTVTSPFPIIDAFPDFANDESFIEYINTIASNDFLQYLDALYYFHQ